MPSLIDDATLSQLRQMSEDTMPDTVIREIYPEPTADEGGGQVQGEPTLAVTMGRLSVQRGSPEAERSGRMAQENELILSLPLSEEVETDERVQVISPRLGTSLWYTVEQVLPSGSFSVHRKVKLKPENDG